MPPYHHGLVHKHVHRVSLLPSFLCGSGLSRRLSSRSIQSWRRILLDQELLNIVRVIQDSNRT